MFERVKVIFHTEILHHCRSCFWKKELTVTSGFLKCEITTCGGVPELLRYVGYIGTLPHRLWYPPATRIAVMVDQLQAHELEETSFLYHQIQHTCADGTSLDQLEGFEATWTNQKSFIKGRPMNLGCFI